MFKMTINKLGKSVIIHNPYTGGNKVLNGQIKLAINKIGQLNFTILPNNDGFNFIEPMITFIDILNTKTNEMIFQGRIGSEVKEMSEAGQFVYTYSAQDELDYLNDSKQRKENFKGKAIDFLNKILSWHNQNLETFKEFKLGTIEKSDSIIDIQIDPKKTTWKLIEENILNDLNLEIKIRKENGIKYLDFVNKIGKDSNTQIKLSVNMIKNSQKINPRNIITRLIPYGKDGLNISSVNNGKLYIDRQDLISKYGINMSTEEFSNITSASQLLSVSSNYMNSQKTISYQYEVEAVNLAYINKNFEDFKEGNSYLTINPVMNINERLRVISRTIDVVKVEKSNLQIGEKFKTAEEWQMDNLRKQTIDLATKESLNQAVTETNAAIDATNATVSNLETTVAETQNYLLSSENKLKLDLISVSSPINLDNIVARIVALEGK